MVPTFGFDYDFFGDTGASLGEDRYESGRDVVALIEKDFRTGSLWGHVAYCKGPKDEWLMKAMVADIETTGQSYIRFKSDGEPAAKAVLAVTCASAAQQQQLDSVKNSRRGLRFSSRSHGT